MAEVKDVYLDRKYAVLRYAVITLYAISVLLLLVGLYLLFTGFSTPAPRNEYEQLQASFNPFAAFMGIISGSVCIGFSIGAVIQAQMLNLFIDLEWNQREIIELQKQQIEAA